MTRLLADLLKSCELATTRRVLSKTKEYLDVFARFKKKENVSAVEHLLNEQTDLLPFEKSQLGKKKKSSSMAVESSGNRFTEGRHGADKQINFV